MSDIQYGLALGFATAAHINQTRKYTGEPYVAHCSSVAKIVEQYDNDIYVLQAALLHDTVEDTSVTNDRIKLVFGERVAKLVEELTDVSKPSDGNRKVRKEIDRQHLAQSSCEAATIKLADLIDNSKSIVENDKEFAKVFLAEKEALLEVLKHGNSDLYALAAKTLNEAKEKLK